MSTFLHESGHFWLEQLKDDTSQDFKQTDEAQVEQDLALRQPPKVVRNAKALIAENANAASPDQPFTNFDPIENAMQRHPGLTRKTAEKMADEFGF